MHQTMEEIHSQLISMFITVFTTACHLSISQSKWIQSSPSHPFPLSSVLILSSHLHTQ